MARSGPSSRRRGRRDQGRGGGPGSKSEGSGKKEGILEGWIRPSNSVVRRAVECEVYEREEPGVNLQMVDFISSGSRRGSPLPPESFQHVWALLLLPVEMSRPHTWTSSVKMFSDGDDAQLLSEVQTTTYEVNKSLRYNCCHLVAMPRRNRQIQMTAQLWCGVVLSAPGAEGPIISCQWGELVLQAVLPLELCQADARECWKSGRWRRWWGINERTAVRKAGPRLFSSVEERDEDGLIWALFIRGLPSDKLSATEKQPTRALPYR